MFYISQNISKILHIKQPQINLVGLFYLMGSINVKLYL